MMVFICSNVGREAKQTEYEIYVIVIVEVIKLSNYYAIIVIKQNISKKQ